MSLLRRLLLALLLLPACAYAEVTHMVALSPGAPPEQAALVGGEATTLENGARSAAIGQGWSYRVVVPPTARCVLSFTGDGPITVSVTGAKGQPIPSRIEHTDTAYTVYASAPADHPMGGALRFTFKAGAEPITVRSTRLAVRLPDANGDGLGDVVERMMGLAPGQRAAVVPRPSRPHTSFQSAGRYAPEIGVPTDAVLAYTSNPDEIATWGDAGYILQTMGGFRDNAEYVKAHPGSAQTDRSGNPLVIGNDSYYMVPTQARIDLAKQYYQSALNAGSTAVCPEEPEYFASAGYSDAFKQEWQARYGAPWQPPFSSVDARYRAEQLKAYLERRQIEAILDDAQRTKPGATRMLALHSPITYDHWGIVTPHYGLTSLPSLDEIIGQVWTGTARTAVRSAGVRAERTFELGYLEYSSLNSLVRGSGKRIWFLMDPVEDDPNRPMEDYHINYEQTLLASLMFPDVDRYEVMPWPTRIYGRVPAGYATEINTVVGALSDVWRYTDGTLEAGSDGIGTFVADSMAWQRAEPSPSDMDGFYGLCLPLVIHGVPAQVLSLDRATEAGYLSRQKTLLLSYDFLKPSTPDANRAIADWVKRGGALVICGGTDAYDAVSDSWWRKAGYTSPVEDLFSQLGLPVRGARAVPNTSDASGTYTTVLSGNGAEHNLGNRKPYTIDLTSYAQPNGSVAVRLEDVKPDDGWGPWVASVELRIGGKIAAAFRTGSELETRFLSEDHDSRFNGDGRFADGSNYWTYRFDNLPRNTPITLTLDMGNGFLVKARSAPALPPLLEAVSQPADRTLAKLRLRDDYPVTVFNPPAGAQALYRVAGDGGTAVWQASVGKGAVIYAGIAPGYLTSSAQSSRWMRSLTARAYAAVGGKYREANAFVVKRGPYLGVRALGHPYTADGRYINLLSPTLAIQEDPQVPAHGLAFLSELGPEKGAPRVAAVSGRLRARSERADATAFLVQAPAKTEGAARLWCGRRKVAGVRAFNVYGQPVDVRPYPDGDTLFLRYTNDPDGVVVRVAWK